MMFSTFIPLYIFLLTPATTRTILNHHYKRHSEILVEACNDVNIATTNFSNHINILKDNADIDIILDKLGGII
jgi:hypothetical protein